MRRVRFVYIRGLALRAGWPSVAPGLVSFSVLASIGVADGGLFPRAWRLGTLALVSIAGAALLARRRIALSRSEWLVIAAFVAYTGWTAASGLWSGDGTLAFLNAERSIVYPAAVLAAVLVTERASVPHLLAGVLAGATVVCGWVSSSTCSPHHRSIRLKARCSSSRSATRMRLGSSRRSGSCSRWVSR